MLGNLSKIITPLALSMSLLTVPSMAFAEKVDAKYEKAVKQEKLEKLNEKLDYLREQVRKTKDFDKAMKITIEKYNNLKVVNSDGEDGKPINALSNEEGWITFTDELFTMMKVINMCLLDIGSGMRKKVLSDATHTIS
ncbi:hypothetical protein [Brevibacillus sp. AF8]|uniref:hypothetical protein n=1 Tax=Brevibacillus sp. AF8 TaxID=2825881 RepID=UPI001E297EF2|nr:hypothetical protein [Brevibacillus sp. AF8]MCE0451984.1 hypothetical protein [Brevibacillus sp. AF8]